MKSINNSSPKFSKSIDAAGKVLKSSNSDRPLVISYIRWSTVIQGEGDSYRRQKNLAEQWCQKNGYSITSEHQMLDAGLSAYKGRNVSEGALGVFLKAVEAGTFPEGTILLVENLDRLSRQHPMRAMNILNQIVEAGIVVVTLGDHEKEYRKPLSMGDMFQAIIDLYNAHVESDKKRERTTANWRSKHAKLLASGTIMTGNCPAWLKLATDKKTWIIDEVKAELIRQIFDWCISGLGLPAIAKRLNGQKVKPWATAKRKTGTARMWTVASVNYILTSRAVIGEFHSKKLGTVQSDYFPVIVSRSEFHRAQAAKLTRLNGSRGRKGKTYTNLFGERAYCCDCGEPMTIRHPKRGRATQFYCKGTLHGTCDHRPWNYEIFEQSFLSLVNELDMASIIHSGSSSRLNEIIAQQQGLDGEKQALKSGIAKLLELLDDLTMPLEQLKPKLALKRQALDSLKIQMATLEKERNEILTERSASQEANRNTFPSDVAEDELYELRAKAAQHIKTVVKRIDLKRDGLGSFYHVDFTRDGGERTVWIDYSNPRKPIAVSGWPHNDGIDFTIERESETVLVGGNVTVLEFETKRTSDHQKCLTGKTGA